MSFVNLLIHVDFPIASQTGLKMDSQREERDGSHQRLHLLGQHFLDEWFDRSGQTVRLRPDAEPTLFAFPTHLLKVE